MHAVWPWQNWGNGVNSKNPAALSTGWMNYRAQHLISIYLHQGFWHSFLDFASHQLHSQIIFLLFFGLSHLSPVILNVAMKTYDRIKPGPAMAQKCGCWQNNEWIGYIFICQLVLPGGVKWCWLDYPILGGSTIFDMYALFVCRFSALIFHCLQSIRIRIDGILP